MWAPPAIEAGDEGLPQARRSGFGLVGTTERVHELGACLRRGKGVSAVATTSPVGAARAEEPEDATTMSCDKIMLIRHAERPSVDKTFRGVNLEGRKDKENLTVRGWQRAGALVRFFAPREDRFVDPVLACPRALYACKAGPAAPSLRPQRTLLPLAELLTDVALDCNYYEGEEELLVRRVLAGPGPALIAWKHLTMHVIADLVLGDRTTAPQYWPFERYDLVWVFDRAGDGWRFTQVPQLLLAGDSPDVVA